MARNNELSQLADVAAVMLDSNTALKGFRICISGHLGKTRKEIVSLIENAGGIFDEAIRYGTTHLLTNADWNENSVDGTSSKFKKAKKYGVKIINEQKFYEMLIEANKGDGL